MRIQVNRMQRSFAAGRAQLLRLSAELKTGGTSLAGLERSVQRDQAVLSERVVAAYESGSEGLTSTLAQRLTQRVLTARSAVSAEAITLGALSTQYPGLAEQVALQRRQLAAAKSSLSRGLTTRDDAQPLDVADTQAISAPAAPSPPPSTGFTFPIQHGDSAPTATWSQTGGGVDIAAPAGTPELAVCAGTVVLHGIGGLGPSAPVLHCDSPVVGADYVYYGYAGPNRLASIGTHLAAGQVISTVGAGVIGTSTGPALEIGFADTSGTPLPGGGAKLMPLLRAAHRG
ncbi:MAG: hypothetical protein WAK93_06225 [Solirubrobacteraceae bacterium]